MPAFYFYDETVASALIYLVGFINSGVFVVGDGNTKFFALIGFMFYCIYFYPSFPSVRLFHIFAWYCFIRSPPIAVFLHIPTQRSNTRS